jgi:small subunit ribosomal protein S9
LENGIYATGKRKTAIARVWLFPNKNGIRKVNGRELMDHFNRETLIIDLLQPLQISGVMNDISIRATVSGGGLAGQAGAMRLGIARALCSFNPEFRPALKSAGMLVRDSRKVERKKYGLHKARRRPQFSKR